MASAPNVKLIEVNVSCPNVKEGGIAFGTEPQMVRELTQAIKAQVDCPVLVKLTPAVTAIEPLVAAEAGGADGLVMINTLMGMEIDLHTANRTYQTVLGAFWQGDSSPSRANGSPSTPSNRFTNYWRGGRFTPADALELMVAGAQAIQIGSASYGNPRACHVVITELPAAMDRYGFERIADFKVKN